MDKRLKEDFPVNWEDDHFVTRREFFRFMTLASGGLAVGTATLAAFAQMPKAERAFEPMRICGLDEIDPGNARAFSYPRPSDLCLLVRRKDGELVGFTRRCTHLSCPVEYESTEESERLYCPCHNGAFSLKDGSVIKGPPPRPLPLVKLEVRESDIWAVGVVMEEKA